jgi:hypothetical protein
MKPKFLFFGVTAKELMSGELSTLLLSSIYCQTLTYEIILKGPDAVYGQITGSLKASVGLESVFSSKEINLDEEN